MTSYPRIYLVVEEVIYRRALCIFLTNSSRYLITVFGRFEDFLKKFNSLEPGVVILGSNIPQRSFRAEIADLAERDGFPVIIANYESCTSFRVTPCWAGGQPAEASEMQLRAMIDEASAFVEEDQSAEHVSFPAQRRIERLSKREHEVLGHLADGQSSKIIAAHLGLSHRTIDCHRAHIMRKLGARNTAEVLKVAFTSGFRSSRDF